MSNLVSAGDSSTAEPSGSGSPTAVASPDPTSADTTIQPGESEKGPVPYDRFNEINTKYNTLKWAEGHDPERVTQQTQFFRWLDQDPVGAFQYMQSYLTRAGVLQQEPANGNGNPPNDRPQPDVIVPETGQRFYSADAAEKLAKWQAEQLVKPIEERLSSFEVDREYQRAHGEAARQIAVAEQWPYYKDHEAEILKEMEKDHRLSLEGAYNRIVPPKIRQLERQAVLTEIQQKSQASTTNPGSSTPTGTTDTSKMSFAQLFRKEMSKRGKV